MSNTERQRRFRERNPGYYKRLHAKRRAQVKAGLEMLARERAIARIIAPSMPPPERCLPAPEQVTPAWAGQLMRDVQSAVAQRTDASLAELKDGQDPGARLRDAA